MRKSQRQGSSHSINVASGGPAGLRGSGSRKLTVKQRSARALGLVYSKLASAERKLNSNSPTPSSNRPFSSDAETTSLVPSNDKLTAGIERLRRNWHLSCVHLLNCRITLSSVSGIYVLAARDFGFDVADSLALNSSNWPYWEYHSARKLLREMWNCLVRQLLDLESVVAREQRFVKLRSTIPKASKRDQLTRPA